MSVRRSVAAFAVTAVLGLIGLAISAASHRPATAFSTGAPATTLAPYLNPGQVACEGPVNPPVAYSGVRAWIQPGFPPAAVLQVIATDYTTGATLATGRMVHRNRSIDQDYPGPQAATTSLHATLPAGRAVSICFRNVGTTVVNLLGGAATSPTAGVLTVNGHRTLMALSLLFLRDHPPSLLSQLPTAFRRASLFRPSWVGEWTFWVLALGLLAAFPIAGLAVRAASRPAEGTDAEGRSDET